MPGLSTDFTEDTLIQRTKRSLGHPTVFVELTDDQITDAIQETLYLLSEVVGVREARVISVSGSGRYEVPRVCRGIIEVECVGQTQSFSQSPFGWPTPMEAIVGSGHCLDMANLDVIVQADHMNRNIMDSALQWHYDDGYLYLQNLPSDVTSVRVHYIKNFGALEDVPPTYQRFVSNYVKALCKRTLGEIRGKYQSVPGAGEQVTLNGDALKSEADTEIEKLDEWLRGKYEDYPIRG